MFYKKCKKRIWTAPASKGQSSSRRVITGEIFCIPSGNPKQIGLDITWHTQLLHELGSLASTYVITPRNLPSVSSHYAGGSHPLKF